MSDTIGFTLLIGIFACAAVFAVWNARYRSQARRRLATLGFEPCPGEEEAIAIAWCKLAESMGGGRREVSVSGCTRRAAGWGMLYHFDVQDTTHKNDSVREGAHVGATWSAYLMDLREPDRVHSAPVALYLAKSGSRVMRELLRSLIGLDAPGAPLELTPQPWSGAIVAAFGAQPGKLDTQVPPAVQEKLAQAADHGFFLVHLAHGKAAFAALGGRRDIDREWAYISQWC